MRCLTLALILTTASPVEAFPGLAPGDGQLRTDIELLASHGVIGGPLDVWPLPSQAVADINVTGLPPHFQAAARRIQDALKHAADKSEFSVVARATNGSALVRDFSGGARTDFEIEARVRQRFGKLDIAYGLGLRDGQHGSDIHIEPVSATLTLGNWAVYGGYVDTWWGPGNDGALLFSTAARPFPKIGVKRLSPLPFDVPVLKLLGPWRFDAFAGRLEGDRSDFDNAGVIGLRFAFQPAQGLEIALNRGLQLCGRQRPCSLRTITDALVGFGDADNTGTINEPGNQLAGFDISYTRRIGSFGLKIYAEAEAEDEDNLLVDKFARLAGATLSGPVGRSGASWRVGGEWADTLAIKAFGSTRYPTVVYRNFIYTEGFTNRRQPIGHGIDGDGRLLSLFGSVTDSRDRIFSASLRRAEINRSQSPNFVSANTEDIRIATFGTELPTGFGSVRAQVRLQDDAVNTSGRTPYTGQVEITLRTRF
jgi:Capsule assembly protein Wzi